MNLKSFPLMMIIDRGETAAIFVPLSMMYETEVYLQISEGAKNINTTWVCFT